MEKASDLSRLVKKAQKDPKAFAQLYAQTFSFSYSVVRRYLNNPQDIEDVLQTSYLYAAKSLSSLREPERFQSWMQTILVHECQKCLHTNKRIADLLQRSKDLALSEAERFGWSELLEQQERYDAVRTVVDSLPNEQKMCAALFYYEEKSVAQIAEMLQVPEGTVKSRLYHVRRKLEKALKKLAKQDDVFFGAAPIPVLRSYFKHGERELAASSLRDSVWAAILSPGSATRTAGHFLRFGAAASGTGGVASSSSAAMTTVIKAAAIAVSAVAVVGGGISAREYIRSRPTQAEETATTASDVFAADEQPLPTEATGTQSVLTTREQSTDAASTASRVDGAVPERASAAASAANLSGTSHVSSTAVSRITQVQTRQTTAQSTAASSTTGGTTTTQPTTVQTTVSTTAQTTTTTTTTTTRPTTTQPTTTTTTTTTTTAPNKFQMSGGVLRDYTGGESSVSIPSTIDGQTVTAIGSGAFASNESLRSVQIPGTVTQIGQQAFSDCTSLQSVSLPSSLTSIGAGAFNGCTSLSSISIPSGTTSIGDDAFYGCTSLRSITIPSSVQSIGDSAFGGCEGLTIRCAENSAAHLYAESHGLNYQLVGGV